MDPMGKDKQGNYLESGRLYRVYKQSYIGNGYQNKISNRKIICVLMVYDHEAGLPLAKYDPMSRNNVLTLDASDVVMYLEEEFYNVEEVSLTSDEVVGTKIYKYHKILLGEEVYWLLDDPQLVFQLVSKEEFH